MIKVNLIHINKISCLLKNKILNQMALINRFKQKKRMTMFLKMMKINMMI